MHHNSVSSVFVLILLWSQAILQADTQPDWLRGVGDQLEMRLRGEVFDATGRPANGAVVAGSIYSAQGKHVFLAKVDGHRFEAWVPLNQRTIYSVSFKASLDGDEQFDLRRLSSFELRQAAIDGIKLSLQVPFRQVDVKVHDAGKPVAGASLIVELDHVTEQATKTDVNGTVRLKLLASQTLTHLTAWTDDFRIGGYGLTSIVSFSRKTM